MFLDPSAGGFILHKNFYDIIKTISIKLMGKRVFFSIPLSMGIKNKIKNVISRYDLPGKVEPEEKWHITLNFIGNVDDNELAKLVFIGKELASKTKNFEIKIKNLMYVPSAQNPKMLWVGVENNKNLNQLKKLIDDKIFDANIPYRVEYSVFSPHVNLARFIAEDRSRLPENLNEGIDLMMTVNEFDLMEGLPKGPSSRYEILERYELE
ncbi:MAG: 2'-5' RNA ligase [Parcubacteria group bacterium GW2011_GWA2_39_18]|nr:MAG: 2'-5' RNA ligase [Parcubacteria group bacterium GW2011_GWA2_39_18]